MDDVRGDFLGPSHGTTPVAVIANKINLRSFKSNEHINEKWGWAKRGFGYFKPLQRPYRFGNMKPK